LLHEEIRLQVALITPLMHVRGHAAPETKAAVERARSLIEKANALGSPIQDPLLLFSVLFGFWIANFAAFEGEVLCSLAAEFYAYAKEQSAVLPLMTAHRLVGVSLAYTGKLAEGRTHYDEALALYGDYNLDKAVSIGSMGGTKGLPP
jgi:hypothetical protein